jgi:outer membrane protein OmpA-like peptidoglycan-associated protein
VNRSPRSTALLLTFVALATSSLGCARHAQRGLVIGAAGGAVLGGVIGKVAGSTAKGAIIGAAVGGAAGAIIGDQMDRQAAELKSVKGARVERVGEGIQVTFESGLLYDFDSDVVKAEARNNLRELASSLEKYPDTDLLILGHTDSVGTADYNKGLSVRRADAAAEYLISQGIRRSRVGTGGLGEEEPVTSNDTETGRQQNRRVEVAIYASERLREEAKRKAGAS